jgi:hypothetical protein
MPLVLKDRVKETSATTGTGTLTLGGAAIGFQSFAVIGNGNTTYYAIFDRTSQTWEVGVGTYTASGTTLSRDSVLESSNGGSLVNFGAGLKDVFCTYPAEKAVTLDDVQTLSNKTISGSFTGPLTGNASTATTLQTARNIGGVSFNGSTDINLPGVNTTGNQNTTGSAATLTTTRTLWGQNFNGSANVTGALSSVTTLAMSGQLTNTVAAGTAPFVVSSTTRVSNLNVATAGTADTLTTARTIGGVSFNGSADINLPGVNIAGNQNTTGTAANVTGTVAIANGGTGGTTAQAARNNLAGTVTSGQYLRGNGTNVLMSAIQAADVPTLNQNTTGTAANITGTAAVANGGTGRTSLTANNILLGNGTSAVNFVAPGTSGNVLTSNGTTWVSAASASGGDYKQVVFTSNGTWTKPAGLKAVKITVVGGGGGGGLTNNTSISVGSGGGGGGGAAIRVLAAASLGATETVTVGSGGASDTAGGTSSFGSFASATGGQPGGADTTVVASTNMNSGGAGGVGSSGNINIKGGGGGFGMLISTTGASGSVAGSGGSSILGGGAISKGTLANLAVSGDSGGLYGGGGGGASARNSSTSKSGGAGAAGIVIVEEFY